MGTHEENMKDPAWLREQLLASQTERTLLEEKRATVQQEAVDLRKALDERIEEVTLAVQGAATLRTQLDKSTEELAETTSAFELMRAALDSSESERAKLVSLAATRRKALGEVVEAVGNVLKITLPLIEE